MSHFNTMEASADHIGEYLHKCAIISTDPTTHELYVLIVPESTYTAFERAREKGIRTDHIEFANYLRGWTKGAWNEQSVLRSLVSMLVCGND